ncbi:hypothetical protein WA026_020117 [Henosepilachna vigintioctopunctata]|uniref:Uncharacterized protein n=1 Tax=Henosepilachna vigintioctopunctata TaxID=420089 RepID=A0AAW1UDB2_9CUCU
MILFACRSFELLIKKTLIQKAWKRLFFSAKAKYSVNCEERSNLADLAVVGLGPSGITACLRAIKHGMKKVRKY